MSGGFTTEELEAVLTSVGRHLDVPRPADGGAIGPAAVAPVLAEPSRRSARLLVAAAAAVVAVIGGVVLIPSTRAAIADLLGIGSTRIEITGEELSDGAGLPHIAQGLDRIPADEAAVILGGDLPDTTATALGPPQAIYRMPEGGVLLAWRDDTATLWIRAVTGSGTAPDPSPETVVRKLLGSGESVEVVDDLGIEALIITDLHLLQTPRRRLAAQHVLLWYDDDRQYRLEADASPEDMIAIARGLR